MANAIKCIRKKGTFTVFLYIKRRMSPMAECRTAAELTPATLRLLGGGRVKGRCIADFFLDDHPHTKVRDGDDDDSVPAGISNRHQRRCHHACGHISSVQMTQFWQL